VAGGDEGPLQPSPGGSGTSGPAEEATAAAVIFAEVLRVGVVDSTNRVLADAARAGAGEGLAAVADEQTAGRGRLGRSWVGPPGSALLCSFLFRPDLERADLHLLTMAVALAARAACAEVAGVLPALKWPNDLELAGRKLAGVLAEAVGDPPAVVVGIGLNLTWPDVHPDGDAETGDELSAIAAGATSLRREGATSTERDELLASLITHLNARYGLLGAPAGRGQLLEEYRAASSTIGGEVRVELAGSTFSGTAVGVTDQGRLLVETDGSLREVEAADVVHLRRH
jgi:BirA family biotin operon repressor/biotin-[acetyl-CoA-carboxylase] ligase